MNKHTRKITKNTKKKPTNFYTKIIKPDFQLIHGLCIKSVATRCFFFLFQMKFALPHHL